MVKPSSDFFASLGQYVYAYRDSNGTPYYIGKGNEDRCWAHVTDKGYDPNECWIVAQNLELFEDKKDWQSFLLESYLIATLKPENNSVSGHYKGCFDMANLSEYFGKFQSEQLDQFESFPEWYVQNYDSLRGRLSELKINSTTLFVKSAAKNRLYMMWWYTPADDTIKIGFEVNMPAGDGRNQAIKHLKSWLKDEGYTKTTQDGVDYKIHVTANSIEEVIDLFKKFNQ
jgi:hypothetical protein